MTVGGFWYSSLPCGLCNSGPLAFAIAVGGRTVYLRCDECEACYLDPAATGGGAAVWPPDSRMPRMVVLGDTGGDRRTQVGAVRNQVCNRLIVVVASRSNETLHQTRPHFPGRGGGAGGTGGLDWERLALDSDVLSG